MSVVYECVTTPLCKNHGEPDGQGGIVCTGVSDPRYTMDFGDVEPGKVIHWCAECGPREHAINNALLLAIDNIPGFAERLEALIVDAEAKR
jgi:hypothetical protein